MGRTIIVAILHNIRSLHNVGSMFRTADGAGISKLFLTGYTGFPPRKEITKTALGAEEFVPWERRKNIGSLVAQLKKEGYLIVAVENPRRNVAMPHSRTKRRLVITKYNKFQPKKPTALIFGNEVRGLSDKTLEKADIIVEIPMQGKKESLNVSVAFGIAAYQLTTEKMSKSQRPISSKYPSLKSQYKIRFKTQ